MACQGRVVNPVLLDEVQRVQGELVLDSLSLALIVVMINTSHSKLTLLHSCVCDGHAEVQIQSFSDLNQRG